MSSFDAAASIESAATPPSSWYTDEDLFSLERESVFAKTWQPVARVDALRAPGDFLAGHWFGEPIVVVCGRDGIPRAFYNVCRHHGAEILTGAGRVDELRCPYHGWSYDLDGRLRKAPRTAGIRDFDREGMSLRPLQLETWGPFVFVCTDAAAVPLAPRLAPLESRLERSRWRDLRFATRRTYEMACNWKVFVDNYLDGGYHVPSVHPELGSDLDLATYATETFEHFSLQSARARESERLGGEVLYAWLYPGFMLNRYGPVLDTHWVVPLAVDRTRVVFDFYFLETEGPDAERFIERSIRASDAIQREDIAISESVQRGLSSGGYDRGRYAPRVETAMHHFHRRLYADLRAGLD